MLVTEMSFFLLPRASVVVVTEHKSSYYEDCKKYQLIRVLIEYISPWVLEKAMTVFCYGTVKFDFGLFLFGF